MMISIFTGCWKVIKFAASILLAEKRREIKEKRPARFSIMKIHFCHNVAEWCSTWLHNFGFPTFTIFPTLRVPNETAVNERENSRNFRTFEMKLLKVVWNGLSCGFYDENKLFFARDELTQCSLVLSNLMHSGRGIKVTTLVQTMMDTRVKFVCAHSTERLALTIDDAGSVNTYIVCWLHDWYVDVDHRSSLIVEYCKM